MYKSDVKKFLKKIKKSVDFTKMIWYIIGAAHENDSWKTANDLWKLSKTSILSS